MRRAELFQLFLRGQIEDILSLDRRVVQNARSQDVLVASLVLRGELEEALALAAKIEDRDASGLVSFFLGLGLARAGNLESAQERLSRVSRLERSKENLVGFFEFQLKGFIAYLQGQLPTEFSRQALAEAETSSHVLEPLARILALDLLGHSYIRAGEVRLGLRTLKLAKRAAEMVRHQSFPAAIAISILKYEAAFGLEPERVMSRLMRALIELDPKDSYSRSELRLELSRQAILRGKLGTARRALDAASPEILGSKNWLQTAWLHLRLAWIAKLEGRPLEVLFSLQSAEAALKETSEYELQSKILNFRLRTLYELRELQFESGSERIENLASRISWTEQKLREMQASSPAKYGIERRLYARLSDLEIDVNREGEDPFGDLMDRLARSKVPSVALTKELLRRGYLGVLVSHLGLRFGRNLILMGLPDGMVLVIEEGEAKVIRQGMGGILGRFLLHLAEGPSTKAHAIESVWGYRYESERHDRLLAVAATRLRKTLGGESAWLSVAGDRISLDSEVVVRKWADTHPAQFQGGANLQGRSTFGQAIVKTRHDGLNAHEIRRLRIRQLQVLEDLATRGEVGVQDLVDRFGISRASALRDLGELVSLGYLIRTGATRATRYILRGSARQLWEGT